MIQRDAGLTGVASRCFVFAQTGRQLSWARFLILAVPPPQIGPLSEPWNHYWCTGGRTASVRRP